MSSEIILSLVRSFREPIIKFIGEVKDDVFKILEVGLAPYLDVYYNKFIKTKTFLFRDNLVLFDRTYFPVSLRHNGPTFKFKSLESFYTVGTKIIIFGNAGSGKSMLMKAIFLKSVVQKIKIPIFIELKQLNEFEGNFDDFIINKLLANRLSPSQSTTNSMLKSGVFIFLLDGYDEIYSIRKNIITNQIEEFIDHFSTNWFVITSRPDAGIESFPRFHNVYVSPLEPNEIEEFINQQCKIIDDKEMGEKLIETIKLPSNEPYQHYLKSPLLLSMFLFTYRNHPKIPKSKSTFYWNVYDTLYTKHDSFTKKGGWQHEKVSGLDEMQFKDLLKWLSYISLFEGIFKYNSKYLKDKIQLICSELKIKSQISDVLYDLTVNIGILQKDGLDYYFPHKSLQEYFASLLICDLNQEFKKKVYSQKFIELAKGSMGGLENFFDLCAEQDPINFKRFYLAPCINNLLEQLKPDLDGDDMVENFISQFDAFILFYLKNDIPVDFQTTYYIEYQENYIYEYLGIKQYFNYDKYLYELFNLETISKMIIQSKDLVEEEFFSLSDNYNLFEESIKKVNLIFHVRKFKSVLIELKNKLDTSLSNITEISNKLLDL